MSAPRLRILEQLSEPGSASGIARRIGLERQQVAYHIRELEKADPAQENAARRFAESLVDSVLASY